MKKILVPTDFSENAQKAAEVAAVIAQKNHATLLLLHANTEAALAPTLSEAGMDGSFDMTEYNAAAAESLFIQKKELALDPMFEGINIESMVEEGTIAGAVEKARSENGIDLIVMGTKGASNAKELFVGSNTEKVIRMAHCPVLSVPQEAAAGFAPKVVALPTTLKDDQKVVFRTLAAWQEVFGFRVEIVYLNNPAGLSENEDASVIALQMAEEAGLKYCNVYEGPNVFNEDTAILKFARLHQADMIAMGTHQRKGLAHWCFGSITEDTANHAVIPVLSIPVHNA